MKAKRTLGLSVLMLVAVLMALSAGYSYAASGDGYVTYPLTSDASQSTEYTVSMATPGGAFTSVPVEGYRHVNYVHFSFSGTVKLRISLYSGANINSYSLGPASYTDITKTMVGTNTIEVTINRPCKLFLHNINGGTSPAYNEPVLWIYADPMENNPPPPSGANIINVVTDRGADNTGVTDCTNILNQALIDSGAQGKIVYVPAGLYKVGGGAVPRVEMQSNSTLYLAGGARLRLDNLYTQPSCVLFFAYIGNARVFGRGSIDANGVWLDYTSGQGFMISAVSAWSADNCSIEGIISQNPSMFNVFIHNSDNFDIINVKAVDYCNEDLALYGGNDGIDLDVCRNCTIDDCAIYSGDDSVSVKGVASGIPRWSTVSGNTYRNCVLVSAGAGTGLGFSDFSGHTITNTCFENCDIVESQWTLSSSLNFDSNSSIAYAYYKNIRAEAPVANHQKYALLTNKADNGSLDNFYFWNIKADTWGSLGPLDPDYNPYGNGLRGYSPTNNITNTTLDHFYVGGSRVTSSANFYTNEYVTGLTYPNNTPVVVTVAATTPYCSWGGTAGVFTFTRSGPTTNALVVPYTIRGSAINGTDYTTISGSVTIDAGATTAMVYITPSASGAGVKTVALILGNSPTDLTWMAGTPHTAQVTIGSSNIPTNMIGNPGFETTDAWVLGRYGSRYYGQAHTGSYSLRIRSHRGLDDNYQYITGILPNQSYTLSCWGKMSPARRGNSGIVRVYFYDSNNGYLGWAGTDITFTAGTYRLGTLTFTTPANTANIMVWVSNNSKSYSKGTSIFYTDDFSLVQN